MMRLIYEFIIVELTGSELRKYEVAWSTSAACVAL
jgi:hypothetical protein